LWATAAPWRQEIGPWRQRRTHGRVQHGMQRRGGQLVRVVLTLLGPAHRWHRGDQRVHRDNIRTLHHRTPQRDGPVSVTSEAGQRPPTLD